MCEMNKRLTYNGTEGVLFYMLLVKEFHGGVFQNFNLLNTTNLIETGLD
jgi:hypothetical protein